MRPWSAVTGGLSLVFTGALAGLSYMQWEELKKKLAEGHCGKLCVLHVSVTLTCFMSTSPSVQDQGCLRPSSDHTCA